MKYYDLFVDTDGESHWRDVAVTLTEQSFAPPAQDILISAPQAANGFVFLRLRSGWDEPIHPTPRAQTLICVAGAVDVTASDGETRKIAVGDIWRMADTWGKGHHTRVTSDGDFESVIIQHD